jgi:prepilin signal peptidase PulO-like enzyme (type II secretory pathway)
VLVFSLLAFRRFGFAPRWWQLLPLLMALALVVVLDLRVRLIPDVVTLPGLLYALGMAALAEHAPDLIEAVLGALLGGGLVFLVAVVSRGGVGGGDIKLMAMLGAALGWRGALVALALSQVGAAAIALGIVVTRRRRPRQLPIGALIALFGAMLVVFAP